MHAWTAEQVVALAPDASSASAGQGLSSRGKWELIAASERAIWGLCKGSGKNPYQTRVDLSEPAFKCSCPSRKFPCKHALGLLLLFARTPRDFQVAPEPDWVAEWLEGRQQRAEGKTGRAKAGVEKPADPEAQARRAAQRNERVQDGVAVCKVWLEDLVRRGLAAAQVEPPATWQRAATQMVDAQAPGLAGFIRRLPETIASGEGWQVRSLDHLGRLHLLLCAAERQEQLPPDLARDVRTALGYAQAKEEALAGEVVSDRWAAVGQIAEEDDRLKIRRTWLVGRQTQRRALILDFAAGNQPLDPSLMAGVEFDAELGFYPSRLPLRALMKDRGPMAALGESLGAASDVCMEDALRRHAEALALNPWLPQWPMILSQVRLARVGTSWCLTDQHGASLPLHAAFERSRAMWTLLSTSGGAMASVAVEWNGASALPLALLSNAAAGFRDLAPRWQA